MSERSPITRPEVLGVLILSLGFGLVGIDRFLITALYPTIAKDLLLGYGDIGTITGALAVAWGIAALLMGNLSDRIGHRTVLVASLIALSLLIGASGLAAGLAGLVLVRLVTGFADGAFTPASIAATIQLSSPERHGRNVGFQQTMLVLFGLGLSPLLVGALLCWLTCLITTSAFLPSYLVSRLKLDTASMGAVMSAIGFGAMAGTIILSALSDRIGRKPVMMIASVGALAGLTVFGSLAASVSALFGCLFAIHFFNNALITLTVGPLAAETVPPRLKETQRE